MEKKSKAILKSTGQGGEEREGEKKNTTILEKPRAGRGGERNGKET